MILKSGLFSWTQPNLRDLVRYSDCLTTGELLATQGIINNYVFVLMPFLNMMLRNRKKS